MTTSYHDEPTAFRGEEPTPPTSKGGVTGTHAGQENFNDLTDVSATIGALTVFILFTGFIAGVFFIICEKYNRFIRFWSFQIVVVDALFFLVWLICWLGQLFDPRTSGWAVTLLISSLLRYAIALFLSWHAYHGARTGILFKLPLIGQWALTQALNAASPPAQQSMQLL